jgi:hypothetical protein
MENMVDRKAYDSDDSGYWQRLPWVMGIPFGLFILVACVIAFSMTLPLEEMTFGILMSLALGVGGGATFGWRLPRKFRPKVSSVMDALYAGNTDLIDEPAGRKNKRACP